MTRDYEAGVEVHARDRPPVQRVDQSARRSEFVDLCNLPSANWNVAELPSVVKSFYVESQSVRHYFY